MNLVLVFFMIFMVLIFIILPFGVKVPGQIEKGHASSAPENPMMGLKILITTIISLVITFFYWYIFS